MHITWYICCCSKNNLLISTCYFCRNVHHAHQLNTDKGLHYNRASVRHGFDETCSHFERDNSNAAEMRVSHSDLPLYASTSSFCHVLGTLHMQGIVM